MKYILATICSFAVVVAVGQSKVYWQTKVVKLAADRFEIYFVANVPPGWHIYSVATPQGGPQPTAISFNKNPLLTLQGAVKEKGELVTVHEEVFGVDVKYYKGQVEFIQVVQRKANVKTNLLGEIEYMICNDTQCTPVTSYSFTVAISK